MDAAESWGASPAPPSCGPRDESASLLSPAGAEVVGQHLQGEADEGLHEVRDGLPRGARPRRESHHQDNLRRLQPLAGRVGGDGALPVAKGSLPGGEVRGAVLLRREAMDGLPAAPRDAGLRGDDRLRRLVGPRRQPGGARGGDSANYPEEMKPLMRAWSEGPSLWRRRTSIICQLRFKMNTDLELLYSCIEASMDSPEFFLQKAIGWSLREYAWSNPDEVKRFVEANRDRLSPLSRREALKHL